MTKLSLLLMGPPHIEVDGQPIDVDTRKAIAMLAYLAVSGKRQSRDALATLLYPEYDQSRGRAALRRTLSALKSAIGKTWLRASREHIELVKAAGFRLDVAEFHEYLVGCPTHGHEASQVCNRCLAPLQAAAELYRDDFMAGFSLRDSATFDEWQFFEAEGLRRELAGVLERLVAGYCAVNQLDLALEQARRWLALDPLREPAHRLLMLLYAWTGQRAAALRQYRECVRILDEELGVPPLKPTSQLHQVILERREPSLARWLAADGRWRGESPPIVVSRPDTTTAVVALGGPTAPAATGTATQFHPLVGRDSQWERLEQAYAAAGRQGHLAVLEGEAGIGKTRLAEDFSAHVRTTGAAVLAARCFEGESHLAYGPFVEALRAALDPHPKGDNRLQGVPDLWLAETARLLPEIRTWHRDLPPALPMEGPAAQSRLFEGVFQTIRQLCGQERTGLLLLDDLQYADEASLDLLTYLVRRLQRVPLFIVATLRRTGDAAGQRVTQLLAEAERNGRATVVRLDRLGQSDVQALVEASAPDDGVTRQVARRLYQETEGVPYFVVEFMNGRLQTAAGVPGDDWPLPGNVRDLLRARLGRVGETGWQLLSAAAVLGRSFTFDSLRAASGRSEEETIACLENLVAQGLIRETHDSPTSTGLVYDFNHEQLRRYVYEETSLARRRLLHRRAAEVLAARPRSQPDLGAVAGQIALHYQLAGREAEAAEYYRVAGEHARSLFANADAVAHYQAALAMGHPEAALLQETVGDLQVLNGNYGAALTAYDTAAAMGDEPALARIEHKLGRLYDRLGNWDLAQRHFEAALAGSGEADGSKAHVLTDWSLTLHRKGDDRDAETLALRALDLAGDDAVAQANAQNVLGVLARSRGDVAEALEHLRQSQALAQGLGDVDAQVAALNNLALAYGDGGNPSQAVDCLEAALALCSARGDRHREAALHSNLADLKHQAGQPEAAMAHLKHAAAIFAEIGQRDPSPDSWQPEVWKLVEW